MMDYPYEYPNLPYLKPGETVHSEILDRIMTRVRQANDIFAARHPTWRELDHSVTSFIYTDDAEAVLQAKDPRKPVSIVMPISSAILDTLITFHCSAQLEMPIFRFEGTGPEDRIAAILLEKAMEHQSVRFKHYLNLYVQVRDALLYGIGMVLPQWTQKFSPKTLDVPGMPSLEYEDIVYEGNRLWNLDPYQSGYDPNVSPHNIQDGEFVYWLRCDNYPNLLTDERRGRYFNVRYLDGFPLKSALRSDQNSGRYTATGVNRDYDAGSKAVDVITYFAKIIPNEWKLGEYEYPELWKFEVAGDTILIGAEKCNYRHGMYPVAVSAPDFDGYSPTPVSRIERTYGIQKAVDFLWNMHQRSQMRCDNGMLIVDPDQLNLRDLTDPEPGRVLQLAEEYWGRPGAVDTCARQLNFKDVTQKNLTDIEFLVSFMERVSGAVPTIQGIIQGGSERRTAAEVGASHQGATSRLQTSVMNMMYMSMFDLSVMCASNTQQFMRKDMWVKVTGHWEPVLRQEFGVTGQYVMISPEQLQPYTDILPRFAAIPGSTNVQAFIQWFQLMLANPIMAQRLDVIRASQHIARETGARNVEDFILPGGGAGIPPTGVDVVSDERARQMESSGEIMPVGAVLG